MTATLELRPATPADSPFLRSLFATSRPAELHLVQLGEEGLTRLLDMQFEAQRRHYAVHYPDARSWLLLEDGEPAGRMLEAQGKDHLLLIDLAVVPAARRRGLATWMIHTLAETARTARLPLRCHVDPRNDAVQLYDRLGFTVMGDEGGSLLLELRPGGPALR